MLHDVAELVVAVATLITAIGGFIIIVRNQRTAAQQINGRVDELIEQARLLARSEGRAEGQAAERDRP